MFTHKHIQRIEKWIPLLLIVVVLLLLPHDVFAQSPTPPGTLQNTISNLVSQAITQINAMTYIIFILLIYVMDPDFIFGTDSGFVGPVQPGTLSPADGIFPMLNEIWQFSRDTMNVVFAFGLIIAAIVTTVTANKEVVARPLKSAVLAIILVNFSWFIPRVIYDISNVVAATIYALPDRFTNNAPCTYKSAVDEDPAGSGLNLCTPGSPPPDQTLPAGTQIFDCKCRMLVDAHFLVNDTQAEALTNVGYECHLGTVLCVSYDELDTTQISGFAGVLNGIVMNHARLRGLTYVAPLTGSSSTSQILIFTVREVLVLVIHVGLFGPLLAMLAAFVMRIPVLWLTMAFMPFYFLGFVIPDGVAGSLKEQTKKILNYFIKAAFLPAIVAIPMAVGFIMINASQQLNAPPSPAFPLIPSLPSFYELVWLIISIGILWTGVFAALRSVEFVAGVTEAIRQRGQALGKAAVKAPLSLPLIPGVGSPLSALRTIDPNNINRQLDLINQPAQLGGSSPATQDIQNAVQTLKTDSTKYQQLRSAVQAAGSPGATPGDVQALRTQLQQLGFAGNDTTLADKLDELDLRMSQEGYPLASGGAVAKLKQ